MKVLITGAAGFIGSAVFRLLMADRSVSVVALDKLTYASSLAAMEGLADSDRAVFERVDITDRAEVERVFRAHRPTAVMHLAAETHVDRSIDGPGQFVQTNVVGTYILLDVARHYWADLPADEKAAFRFHHISTDEVYGTLGAEGKFTEETPYAPNSPYSASKASSDHLVRAWHHTYGLPVVVSNCSNNYGPYQFPEKLIPLMIIKALAGEPLPIYGTGENVRDWLYVEDHARALWTVLTRGVPGEQYNIGGNAERSNNEVVRTLCAILDELCPDSPHRPHADRIAYVADRPGHDRRYAIDADKIRRELGWTPAVGFEEGLRATVRWYLDRRDWWEPIRAGQYDGRRIGLGG